MVHTKYIAESRSILINILDKILLIMQWIFVISLSLFVRNFMGTRSSAKMLKGHMVRERLGTPDL